MAIFILRVQLTNETNENYTILKNALLKAGFTKKIAALTGVKYILPNGNYLADSEKSGKEIIVIVQKILNKLGDSKAQILLTESKVRGNTWVNLSS